MPHAFSGRAAARLLVALAAGMLLLRAAVPLPARAQFPEAREVARIPLPRNADPTTVMVLGAGSRFEPRGTTGNLDLVLRNVQPGKVLVYCPGYQILTADLRSQGAEPLRFRRARMVRVTGQLLDTDGEPAVGQALSVRYSLFEAMSYFGYIDGMVPQLPIASATTDDRGRFALQLPPFADDPFFQRWSRRGDRNAPSSPDPNLTLHFAIRAGERASGYEDRDIVPAELPVRRAYEKPLALQRIYRGQLSGRIEKSFLEAQGLTDFLATYLNGNSDSPFSFRLGAEHRHGTATIEYNLQLRPDGSFHENLPVGVYTLNFTILNQPGSTLYRKVVVQREVSVREKQNTTLSLR